MRYQEAVGLLRFVVSRGGRAIVFCATGRGRAIVVCATKRREGYYVLLMDLSSQGANSPRHIWKISTK